ncbi:MAG: hypothetical protein M0R05_07960 [Bacilli bacterium]|nr:hypothetical protein [Bacilli bacterium]MDD4077580.1 hypothetical protein [Bacilli bacterium]
MRKRKKFSIFNNFNRNYNENQFEPNYYNEYENEFSEELFNRDYERLNRRNQEQGPPVTQDNNTVDQTQTDQNPEDMGDHAAEPRNWQ